jgi:O-antigen ligase
LQALVETGLPGFLCWLLLVCFVLWTGFLKRSDQAILPFFLALLTFFLHTMVNDFLHDGRIAALVWGSMAMIFVVKKED